jgi:iron complex outermembrane receptor protein
MHKQQVKRQGLWWLALTLSGFQGISAAAEELLPPGVSAGPLEEIVVTATRYPQELDSIPANISVITADDIAKSVARNIPELLRAEVGLHVNDITGNGQSYTVDIRGFGETAGLNTLVLVDGRRITSADLSGTDWSLIPLDRVDRIEIVRGSRSSVIYGDNASGGVINIITREGEALEAGAEIDMGSYGTLDTSGYLRGSQGDFTYALSASRQHSEGYRQNSETDSDSVGVNFRYYLTPALRFDLSGGYTSNHAGLPGSIKASDFAAGAARTASLNPDDFADIEDYYVKGEPELQLGENTRIKVEASFRKRQSTSFATFVGGDFTGQTELRTTIVSPQLIVEEELLGLANHLSFGFDYVSNEEKIVNRSIFFGVPTEGRFDLAKKDYGYFIYEEIVPLEGLSLSAGYRYDRADFTFTTAGSGSTEETSLDENVYTAGVSYLVNANLAAYFSFSRGFRYPVLDETFNFFSSTIDSSLRPQVSRDYEAGVRYAHDAHTGLELNLFQIETDDEIFLDPAFFSNTNLDGTTRRRGVEVFAYSSLGKLDFSAGYTYTDADIISGSYAGSTVPGVPAHRVTLAAFMPVGERFSLAANAVYVGRRPFISDFANAFPDQASYFVMNAKLKYKWRFLSVFVDLNNLTNSKYSEYGVLGGFPTEQAFYPSPEFNLLAGIAIDL